ncbi:MAG: GNAT family N-acetyltransferase [Vicingus serpentipes]|nr:GNAT family N-acetyltransferase [Vicingus serpentipes]
MAEVKTSNISYSTKPFKELSVEEYHHLLFLRTAVFVVEQNCPYQEVDEKDPLSYHLFGKNEQGEVIAVTRIVPPGISYPEISIGRVAIKKEYRERGLAHELIRETLSFIKNKWGKESIRISAQEHLTNYYQKHGFKQVGEMYLEDNIPHVEMLKES